MTKTYLLASILAIALSGCSIVSKAPSSSSSRPVSASEPKNHGQQRSADVHERNAERKAAHDAEKAEKKAGKK